MNYESIHAINAVKTYQQAVDLFNDTLARLPSDSSEDITKKNTQVFAILLRANRRLVNLNDS